MNTTTKSPNFVVQLVGTDVHAAASGVVGQWDEERQMMFYYPVDGEITPVQAPLELAGINSYTTSLHHEHAEYFSLPEEAHNLEMAASERSVELNGTTYYHPPAFVHQTSVSGTSGYCSSDEGPSSEPTDCFDEINWSDEFDRPSPLIYDFTTIHEVLETLIMSADEMELAGYPAINEQGRVQIQPSSWDRGTTMWIDENEPLRKCSRCRVAFAVGADGRFPTAPGICQSKSKGQWNSEDGHITMQRFASELEKFAESPAPNAQHDARSDKIFALDVEMVSTTAGPALARLSVVDFDGRLVLDVFVKPEAPVVDYLTEFSGITKEMLGTATHTLESCRDLFFELVNSKSILIGHGLDGDLKALRVIHQRVIDTSILYQDEGKKVALRILAKQYLGRTIQADNSSTFGHSSEEDALASLDLVKHQIGLC